jgi:hypothetical protein
MSNKQQINIYEIADGDIDIWLEPGGSICLKTRTKFNDPIELAEHEAIELAQLLLKLVKEQRE